MALVNKEHLQNESAAMAIIQASGFYDQDFGGSSLIHPRSDSSPENHVYGVVYREPDSSEKAAKNFSMSNSSSVSSPSSTNSNGLGYQPTPNYTNFIHVNAGSLLSFDRTKRMQRINLMNPKMIADEEDDHYPMREGDQHLHYHGPPETSSSHHDQWAWLNDQEANRNQEIEGGGEQESTNNKRPSTGESLQAMKKQDVAGSKKTKSNPVIESKEPQSLAAKNRRERISERLKTLQELVPNGSKVDLVTMLEKAIGYVKFLQLQVKVLATDEFWPAQGGKAPDLGQVREAIDAILASQRDQSSEIKMR